MLEVECKQSIKFKFYSLPKCFRGQVSQTTKVKLLFVAEHSEPGATGGGPSRVPAGERGQGGQEEPVRPGRAGRGRPEGRPIHQSHRREQAHSHC